MFKNSPRVYRSDEPVGLRIPLLLSGLRFGTLASRAITPGSRWKNASRLVAIYLPSLFKPAERPHRCWPN